MSNIKLCIFDMDGLLLNTERDVWMAGGKKIAKELGVDLTDEFIINVVGLGFKIYKERLTETYGKNFPSDLYIEKLFAYFENACINEVIALRPGVKELLEFLKKNNILISVATSTSRHLAENALKNSGIFEYLDFCVYGDEVKNLKPDPEIFNKAIEHFDINKDECLIFEDGQAGAKAAYTAKVRLVLVPDLTKPSELDKQNAFAILKSIDEIIPIIKKENNIK